MNILSIRCMMPIGLVALALTTVASPILARPTTDQNLGAWWDPYDDDDGLAPELRLGLPYINGLKGQDGIARDPIARSVSLRPAVANGFWFTSEIEPASFDAWEAVYLDYSASVASQVKIEIWDVTNGEANAVKQLGPTAPIASGDPAYPGKVLLPLSSMPTTVKKIRVRVVLAKGAEPIGPTVTALKVKFNSRSILLTGLEVVPPTPARPSGDALTVRMPVSISYVNATDYVAFVSATSVADDRYGQAPTLGFDSATLGGQWTLGGTTILGVTVPPRSVYWTLASQEAGKTYAYYATFRSPNALVRDLGFNFVGEVHASNAATVTTPTRTARIDARPATGLLKNAGGTFIIGGRHFARNNANITLTVSPLNWWNQAIPNGAQTYFQPVVWDSFQDFIDQGVIASNAAVTVPAGAFKTGNSPITVRGITVPKNSAYWLPADMAPGARLDLSYSIQLPGDPSDNGKTINNCGLVAPGPYTANEAHLATPQESIAGTNACATGACDRRTACLPITIGLDSKPGFSFAKGDQINGSVSILGGGTNDNPFRYVTYGEPIEFKMAVGNSGISSLDNVVIYDSVPSGATFVSASVPVNYPQDPTQTAQNKVWYWKTAPPTGQPELYSTGTTVDTTNWDTTRPPTVTWVAFEIPRLRSSYCDGTPLTASNNVIYNCTGKEPAGVTVDFTVKLPEDPFACSPTPVTNTANVKVYGYTPPADTVGSVPSAQPTSPVPNVPDSELVIVRPLVADLSTTSGSGTGTAEPGQQATHSFTIQNRSAFNNPIDTARNVVAKFTLPTVKANGIDRVLTIGALTTDGGIVSYGADTVTVTWDTIIPNSSKTVAIKYYLPLGIRDGQYEPPFRTTLAVAAELDSCIEPKGAATVQTVVGSAPGLYVQKDLDFRVVSTDTPVTYTLTYVNIGTAPSTRTWIIDRIADETVLNWAEVPVGGEVWFSSELPPFDGNNPTIPNTDDQHGLPSTLLPEFAFTDAAVTAHFQPSGVSSGNATAPAGTKWVAFLVDSPTVSDPITGLDVTVSPALFETDLVRTLTLEVEVVDPNNFGQIVTNEAAIISNELDQSIGERVSFIVSPEPGIDLAKDCPDIVTSADRVIYTISFRNDTTNPDDTVTVTDILPAELDINDASDFGTSGTRVLFSDPTTGPCVLNDDSRWECTWTFANVGDTVTSITIDAPIKQYPTDGAPTSGTPLTNQVLATATNGPVEARSTKSFYDECTTIVENANLQVVKLVDNPEPRSGKTVTYTIELSNINRHEAQNVVLTDLLPANMTQVGGITVLTPGWIVDPAHPTLNSLQLKKGNLPVGFVPGLSGPIRFSFQAMVNGNVSAGTLITNQVDVGCLPLTQCTGEDPPACVEAVNCPGANTATVPIKTPLPDPYVQISATPIVKPGDLATWTLLYGNDKPEDSNTTVVFFTLPDGPGTSGFADFTLTGVTLPSNVLAYYSTALITADPATHGHPAFDPTNPSAWTLFDPANPPAAPGTVVNHLAFYVKHCDADPITLCEQGDLEAHQGPFQILVKTTARLPDLEGTLPGLGATFEGWAHIAITDSRCTNAALCESNVTNNGPVKAVVKTPGIGLKVTADCNPKGGYPGIPPGGDLTFSFTFENTGTVPAFGVNFDIDLDDNVTRLQDTAGQVIITDATGAEVNPIGLNGNRLQSQLTWSRVGSVITLGPPIPGTGPVYGLAPGDRGTITVSARVNPSVADSTSFTNQVYGWVVGRSDLGDVPETAEALLDNTGTCGSRIYRADVFVIKSITNVTDPTKGYADGGDTLHVNIEYGNAGHYAASNVVMTDSLVEGLALATNTERDVPYGAHIQFDDGSGNWSYQPSGDTDPKVRAIRVVYDDNVAMPAPAGTVFSQTTVQDFDEGDYNGTVASDAFQAVLIDAATSGSPVVVPNEYADDSNQTGPIVFSYSPGVIMIAYAHQQFSGAMEIGQVGFRGFKGSMSAGTRSWKEFKVELAYLNPRYRAGNDGPFALDTHYSDNTAGVRAGTTVHEGPLTMTFTNAPGPTGIHPFDMVIPFSAPFAYDPSKGDLLMTMRFAGASTETRWSLDAASPDDNATQQSVVSYGDENATDGSTYPQYQLITQFGPTDGAAGTYTSPVFPADVEGHVLDWGLLVVNATFGGLGDSNTTARESMDVEVFVKNGQTEQVLKTYHLTNGTGTYTFDLNGVVDPADYQKIQVRAVMTGLGGQCIRDIAPDQDYSGFVTGLSEHGDLIGFARLNNRQKEGGGNLGAFTFSEPKDELVALHSTLPGTSTEPDADNPWYASLPSDINDEANATVVGWADTDTSWQDVLPADCNVTDTRKSPLRYAPLGIDIIDTGEDQNVTLGANTIFEWSIPAAQLGDENVTIDSITLRSGEPVNNDPDTYYGLYYFYNLRVKIGYMNPELAVSGLEPEGNNNFNANLPSASTPSYPNSASYINVYESGDAHFNIHNLPIPYPNFTYDPSLGDLLIQVQYDSIGSSYSGQRMSVQVSDDSPPDPDNGLPVRSWYSGSNLSAPVALAGYPVTKLNDELYSFDVQSLVVWKETGGNVPWQGYCLPLPDDTNGTRPYYAELEFPRESNVFVNDSGLIAASAGATRAYGSKQQSEGFDGQGSTDPRFGRPTVWCQDPSAPTQSHYRPIPIRTANGDALQAIVTGLSNDGTVIGVTYNEDIANPLADAQASSSNYTPVAWRPIATDAAGCPSLWIEHDLSTPLWAANTNEDIISESIAPLDIDASGRISGYYQIYGDFDDYDRLVAWRYNGSTYELVDLQIPVNALTDAFDRITPDTVRDRVHPNTVTQDMVRGLGDFGFTVNQDEEYPDSESVTSWVSNGFAPTQIGDPEDFGTLVSGTGGDQVVGLNVLSEGDANIKPFYWKAGKLIDMGSFKSALLVSPAFVARDGLVAGHITVGNNQQQHDQQEKSSTRVFVWRECSNTPRLDDWKVTYQTDKNPQWGFDVELADICTTSISNAAEITTTTPEIRLDNNSSRTSIPVNTADLAVTVSLDQTVLDVGQTLSGLMTLANNGPGMASDVDFFFDLPSGCNNINFTFNGNSTHASFDTLTLPFQGYAQFDQFAAGEQATFAFTCVNTITTAGAVLAANASVGSPTIDCHPDNDQATQPIVVGEFPNVWTDITGPTSSPIGAPTPYVLTFGNDGNDDTNGTVVLTLPPGASFDCSSGTGGNCSFCNGKFAYDVSQAGVVTFTPTAGNTFSPGLTCAVPFQLTWNTCGSANLTATLESEVLPNNFDADISDNTAHVDTLVTAPTGALQLTVDRSDTSVELNKEFFYTYHFANLGYAAASGARLDVTLPSGLEIQEVLPSQAFTAGAVTFNVGRGALPTARYLLPGDAGAVTMRVKVVGPVGAPGLARLYAASGACEVSAPIVAPALVPDNSGLHILVSPSHGTACGDNETPDVVSWLVTVTNPGAEQRNVPIQVVVPEGLRYVKDDQGSIEGIGAIDTQAPTLLWVATIPTQGTLSFGFKTTVLAGDTQLIGVSATAGAFKGSGSLAIDCEDRVIVSKSWGLTCAVEGAQFPISVTVTNSTTAAVSGKLVDTFQVGADAVGMDGKRTISFDVNLLPGASKTFDYTVAIPGDSVLRYGDPIFDRAVFYSQSTVQAVSNQVVGAVANCGANTYCVSNVCEPFLGCQVIANTHGAELCGNEFDDDCDGLVDEDFEHIGEPCNASVSEGDLAGDECYNDQIACNSEDLTATICQPIGQAEEICDGEDNDCDDFADEGFELTNFGGVGEPCDGDDDNGTCERGIVVCDGPNAVICDETGEDPTSTKCSDGKGVCLREGHLDCDGVCDAEAGQPETGELCGNGLDDNCDGIVDLDFAFIDMIGVLCDSNATNSATPDTDLCIGGTFVCDSEDRTAVTCNDDGTSIPEACGGGDENCDGVVDEGFAYTDPQGQVIKIGQRCDGTDSDLCEGGVVVCSGNVPTCTDDDSNATELCNGIDDNCDGRIDEDWTSNATGGDVASGPYLGLACDGTNDADLCEKGKFECDLDFTGIYCHEVDQGVVEVCNNRDDTCDGTVDEGFGVGDPSADPAIPPNECTVGIGACKNTGVLVCIIDSAGDDNETAGCSVDPLPQGTEICNGLDDNCDGFIDDPGMQICKPLETQITTGPPVLTASTTATFTYINPLGTPTVASHTTFECSLDGAAYTVCNHIGATPNLVFTNLAQGQHTLLVRATRGDGAVDPTPAFWVWVIDTTVPDTTILSAPTNPSQSPSGTFVFGSPTPNPDFYMCVLDPVGGLCPATGAATYVLCNETYPYTALADGSHTMCVYVTNTAGTPDPIPATYTWIIDTTAPETEIIPVIPPKVTSSATVVFHYYDPTAPTTNTFECSLDGANWIECDGKTDTYTNLPEGEHVFEVRTIDPNGVIDPTPATYTWIIDRTGPCPTIAAKPSDPAQSGAPVFGFTATETAVSYFCALDPLPTQLGPNGEPVLAAYKACEATASFSGLTDGTHTMWVYAQDVAGNIGTCRASYTWLIDSRFPETEITNGPTPLIGSGEVSIFDYIDPTNEDTITFECSLDGAAFTRCDGTIVGEGGTIEYADLPVGKHDIKVRTCDLTKAPPVQCDPTPAVWVWEVTVSPCPNDHTAPAVACAADLVLECVNGGATVVLDDLVPTANDGCMPVETTTSASASIGLGQSPIVFTSEDPNGNMSSCVTLVNVVDTTKPTISCPADVLTANTDDGVCTSAVDIAAATGSDGCQGTLGLLVLDDAPNAFIPGETIVTHQVIDSAGNVATCQQTVVVVDDEPLVLTCSDSVTVDAEADRCDWSGIQSALATDNCAGELTVDVDGTYPIGVSPILFTAADAAGLSDECVTELTVRDVTKPVVTCGVAVGVLPTIIRATATDACMATVTLENVVCTRVSGGTSTPIALANCPIEVNGDAIEINGRLSEGELTITYDARAIDPSGNFAVVNCNAAYDPDKDGDGIIDAEDNCVLTLNGDQTDADDDGIGDSCDVCPDVSDADQADVDGDGVGDACSDKDKDGVLDLVDNCEDDPNSDQTDVDDDELGDACDPAPYEGITAEGDGGCSGGAGSLVGGLLGLAGLMLATRSRRRETEAA